MKLAKVEKYRAIILIILITGFKTFGQSTTEIAKSAIKSTVSIVALDNYSQPLGYGSGFIIDNELIATNAHVVEGCNSAYISLNKQGKNYKVDGFVAIDRVNDLIILKVSGLYGAKLTMGFETLPEIGERIFAIGNPKGLSGTFSEGIISGIRDLSTSQVLQITAPISPGSSGGAVLNSFGQVIGIAFASFTSGQNLNFAIPVKYLIRLKSKISSVTSLSSVKPQPKTNAAIINPNIKEGISIRNIIYVISGISNDFGVKENHRLLQSFSFKNNLPYTISHIKILFIVYDKLGIPLDYLEETYYDNYSQDNGIKPFLAKTVVIHDRLTQRAFRLENNFEKIELRILDFKIKED